VREELFESDAPDERTKAIERSEGGREQDVALPFQR
jgi:hypothetical protein